MRSNISAKRAITLLTFNRVICYIVLGLLTVLCLFSFYFLIVNATRPHASILSEVSLVPGNYLFTNLTNLVKDHSDTLPILNGMLNSLFISTCVAVLTTYFSAMTAYGIHAYNFKFKKAAFAFIMMIMMVPTQVTALGFYQLINDMKMMNTYYPLILPSIAAPVAFYFMKAYMESILPLEIIEAARVDGSNEFRTFNFIVVPIIKPAMAVQAIFAFVASWNNFFIPALILQKPAEIKTIPVLIAVLRSADYMRFDFGQIYVMVFMSIIPLMIVYFFLSRFIIRGLTLGSVKG